MAPGRTSSGRSGCWDWCPRDPGASSCAWCPNSATECCRLSRDERFQEFALQRLTRDELRHWIEAVLGRQDVEGDLLPFLYQQTEGNPLLVVQVLRTMMEEGALWHTGERWAWRPVSELELPVAVTDLVARRLERLSPKARNILTGAAVIGRVFDLDLAIAAGVGTGDELLDGVDEGMAAAVLES